MEQGDQCVHRARVQSRSQDPVLQARDSSGVLHCSPPFFGFTSTLRVRSCTPPSQSAEHPDHPDHSDISQSTGQGYCPQRMYFCRDGHLMPQLSFLITTSRLIRCHPPHSK